MYRKTLLVLATVAMTVGYASVSVSGEASTVRSTASTQDAGAAAKEAAAEAQSELTEAYLKDPAHIEAGRELWQELCRHCHGASAYPGKAPKLKPRKYTPEFVFGRVTNGFRKMPAWGESYSREELMNVTAYVLSKSFAP